MFTYRCTVQFVSSIPKLTRIFSSEGGGGFDGFSNLSYKKNKLIYIGFFKIAPNLPLPSERGNMKKYDFRNPQVFTQLEDKAILITQTFRRPNINTFQDCQGSATTTVIKAGT